MDYAAIQVAAREAIRAAGQTMALSRASLPAYNPVTGGQAAAATEKTWPVCGVITNYNSVDKLSAATRDGSLIREGDRKVLLEAGEVVPQPGDSLTIAGVIWKMIAVDPVDPAGTPLIFKCQVRR